MINRKTLAGLAAVTLVLFVVGALMGEETDIWIIDDVVFIGFILSALALIAMSVAVLVRSATSRRAGGSPSSTPSPGSRAARDPHRERSPRSTDAATADVLSASATGSAGQPPLRVSHLAGCR